MEINIIDLMAEASWHKGYAEGIIRTIEEIRKQVEGSANEESTVREL